MKNLISFDNFGGNSHSMNEAEAAKEFDRTKPFSISPADPYEYKYYAPKKEWYTRNRSENNPKWKDMKKTLGSKFQVAYETIEGAIKAGKAVNVSGGAISSPYNSLYITFSELVGSNILSISSFNIVLYKSLSDNSCSNSI